MQASIITVKLPSAQIIDLEWKFVNDLSRLDDQSDVTAVSCASPPSPFLETVVS